MTSWQDLADSELRRRLTQRGYSGWVVNDLIGHRDDPQRPDIAQRISEILEEPQR